MTRNLKASLLIASMLVVLWTTSSEACHRRRACQPTTCYCQSGYTYGSPTGYYGAEGGYATADGGYYGGGYTGGTAGYPGRVRPARLPGTTSAGPATTRAASVGRRPGSGCGPAWGPAASALALTVHRFSDHPAGRAGLDLRAHSGRCRRRPADGRRGRFTCGRRRREFQRRPVRPGVTPVATRPLDPAEFRRGGRPPALKPDVNGPRVNCKGSRGLWSRSCR